MSKVRIALRWALVILVFIAALGFAVWRMRRAVTPVVSPVEGNPQVPVRPPEAVRLEKMFEELMKEQSKKTNASPATTDNEEQ